MKPLRCSPRNSGQPTPGALEADRQYQLIFEEAIIGIYPTTAEGRLLSANSAMARMFGFDSPGEMMTCITDVQPQLYVDPTGRHKFQRLMDEHGVVRNFELQVYRKDRGPHLPGEQRLQRARCS